MVSYLPAQTGKRVYFGHKEQTPNYQERLTKTLDFYSGKLSVAEAQEFLRKNHLNFIVYSDEEKQSGELPYEFLKSVYRNDKIEIFQPSEI
jgi:hypothetical protein